VPLFASLVPLWWKEKMKHKTTNLLLCGVGGQGILLASEIISSALMRAGYDVKQSEVHGMAQRGGSVVAHLRYGTKVYSPLIELERPTLRSPLSSLRPSATCLTIAKKAR